MRCCHQAGGCCHSFEEQGYEFDSGEMLSSGCCHSFEEQGYEFDSGEMLSSGRRVLSQLRGTRLRV